MIERIERIREDVKNNVHNHADELTVIGLRQIELLEEIKELLTKENEDARGGEQRNKRSYHRSR